LAVIYKNEATGKLVFEFSVKELGYTTDIGKDCNFGIVITAGYAVVVDSPS
jgi:hypothetical protein